MTQKIVIISGGSRGIGKAIALKLAQQNYTVIIGYSRNADAANELVQQIKQNQGHAVAIKADVSKSKEVKELFKNTLTQFGRIDAVINTAGIAILKSLSTFSEDEFNLIMQSNVTGTFNILQQAAQHVNNGGRILTFSSNVVETLPPTYAAYAASKAAVEVLTKVLSKELRGRNININVISPGPTTTEMFFEGKDSKTIDTFIKMSPLERLGTPEDIANVVYFLLSDEGIWINGQVLKVNGGLI